MSPWVPVAVTVLFGICGLAVQGALVAFSLGKMREQQAGASALFESYKSFQAALLEQFRDHQEKSLAALTQRMNSFEQFGEGSSTDRARLNIRLDQVEKNTAGLQQLAMEVAANGATARNEHEHQNQKLDALNREVKNIHAQLRNLVTGTANRVREVPPND